MKKTGNSLRNLVLGTGVACFAVMALSAAPAMAKCIKKNPLFGFNVYVDDKYCPKKAPIKKVVKVAKAKPAKRVVRPSVQRDPEVLELQKRLNAIGYDAGPADGVEGPKTKAAAKAFKKSVGMRVGTDNEETLEKLRSVAGN